jgi:hypothetical protein
MKLAVGAKVPAAVELYKVLDTVHSDRVYIVDPGPP